MTIELHNDAHTDPKPVQEPSKEPAQQTIQKSAEKLEERLYHPAITNMLGYLAEKTDLLQKLVELEASASETSATKTPGFRKKNRKTHIREQRQAIEHAYAHIIQVASNHIKANNPHFDDFAHLLASQSVTLRDLRIRADQIAGFSIALAAREAKQKPDDKTKIWVWRNIAGRMVTDMLLDIKVPRDSMAFLLNYSMEKALKIRQQQEKEGIKKTAAAFRELGADFQPINTLIFNAYRILRKNPDEDAKPKLKSEGDALLWVVQSLADPSPDNPNTIEHSPLVYTIDSISDEYTSKPSTMLTGFYYVVLDLLEDPKTQAGTLDGPHTSREQHRRDSSGAQKISQLYDETP